MQDSIIKNDEANMLSKILRSNCVGDYSENKRSKFKLSSGYVGIEIEVEGVKYEMLKATVGYLGKRSYWSCVKDGSLKDDGGELLFRVPLAGKKIDLAFSQLRRLLKVFPNAYAGPRTGLHVHLNITDLSLDQLRTFLGVYVIFEKVLFHLGGQHREGNNNCLPSGSSRYFIRTLRSLCSGKPSSRDQIYEILVQSSKYEACNVSSIIHSDGFTGRMRGSVEFRMHEGTLDIPRIENWVHILQSLKDFSKEEKELHNLPAEFSNLGSREIVRRVFPSPKLFRIVSSVPDLESKLLEGLRNWEFIVGFPNN